MASRIETLVLAEIKRIVEEAANQGASLPMAACVDRVMRAFPNCGFGEQYLKSEILIAATSSMVSIVTDRKLVRST